MVKELQVSETARVLLADVKLLQPALDCNPNEILFLTIPLPGVRMNEKKGSIEEKGEMILCTITDRGEIFETTQQEFMKRGLLAQIPHPILEQRWSAQSIQSFLEGEAPNINPWEVFQSVREKFDYYVDFDVTKSGATVCAVYTIASYFFFLFEYFPYLKFGGEKGSGKTKTGSIFASLCFNAQIFANATKAAIYRTAHDTRGTMVIDEGESLAQKSEEQAAYMQVLNSGWQRNGYAIISDKETLRPTKWSTFCPKIICSIGGLEEVLDERAFEIILLKTLNKEKADREVSTASKEWQPLRDNLYLLLLQKWKEVQSLIPGVTNTFDFSGRIWNLAKPLITVARFIDKYRPETSPSVEEEVKEFIQLQAKEKTTKTVEGFASTVITALKEIMKKSTRSGTLDESKDTYVRIGLNDLTETIKEMEGYDKLSPKSVARTLTNLGLYKEVRRDGKNGARRFGIRLSDLIRAEARLLGGGITDKRVESEGVSIPASESSKTPAPSVTKDTEYTWYTTFTDNTEQIDAPDVRIERGVDDSSSSAGQESENTKYTFYCSICHKPGGRVRIVPGMGVLYLHPACEKDWSGKL